jgi:hypothetical protein
MNESKTSSMLQRVPVILAVTAASYGLQVPAQAMRWTAPAAQATAAHSSGDTGTRRSIPHSAPAAR